MDLLIGPGIGSNSLPFFSIEVIYRLYRELVPDSNTARWRVLCETFKQAAILEARFWDMGLFLQK